MLPSFKPQFIAFIILVGFKGFYCDIKIRPRKAKISFVYITIINFGYLDHSILQSHMDLLNKFIIKMKLYDLEVNLDFLFY